MGEPRFSRGQFLTGAAGALTAGGLLRVRPAQATPNAPVIDVHGHAITATFESLLAARADRQLDGRALPRWSPEAAVAFQDQAGIDLQVLSTPDPALSLVALAEQPALARALNDELAAVVAAAPQRFGGLAVLPLRSGTSAALAELSHAISVRRLDGVVLPTDVAGRSLADPVFVPVLHAIARRRVPVLLHPGSPRPVDWPDQQGVAADTLEHAFASVRCAANLLYRGTFLRAPRLRLTLAGGGGGLAFVAGRVALADQALRTELFVRPLRRLSFDTAQSAGPGAVASLRAFVRTPTQVMYGSDWPLVDQPTPPATVAAAFGDTASWVLGAAAVAMFPTLQRR